MRGGGGVVCHVDRETSMKNGFSVWRLGGKNIWDLVHVPYWT